MSVCECTKGLWSGDTAECDNRIKCAPARTKRARSERNHCSGWFSSRVSRTHTRSKHAVGLQNAVQTKTTNKDKKIENKNENIRKKKHVNQPTQPTLVAEIKHNIGPYPMLIFQAQQRRRRRRLGC
ncbi:unnamed protein product, partial [Ectocarpus sp. 8 AP-2014]